MTYSVNNTESTITIAVGEETITIPLDKATDLVVAVLDARKAGYAAKREGKAEAKASAAKERAAKKDAREKAATKRKADRVKKLEKQLAELKKAA